MPFRVFISYARVDNIIPAGSDAQYGFISLLRAILGQALLRMGDSDVSIWRDKSEIEDGEQFTRKIRNAINESQMIVIVLTPASLKSAYCRQELEAFTRRWGADPDFKDRFMVVLRTWIASERWPDALTGQSGYRFYVSENDRDGARETPLYRSDGKPTKQFYDIVESMARLIHRRAQQFGQTPVSPSIAPKRHVVYVAQTPSNMDAQYRPVEAELQNDGYEVDLPETFPPLRSLGRLANNLPHQVTSFIGRDEEVVQIKKLVERHRLVTLVGMGGGGKTRCAIQAASELLGGFANGVWLVELAPISSGSLVVTTIARTVGARESPKTSLLGALLTHLERWDSLLVIDNCEHVLDEVRSVVAAMLRQTAGMRVLATSREALNIAGEHAFHLPSLAVPPIEAQSPDTVLRYGATALFNDRAQSAHARFILTNENARFVGEIARRLDGIPLAIELAAARVKVLSPQQLAQRLNERFRVLTGGDRSALPRHQTMRALIDWSYDLLSEHERTLFRKVSIFADTFTLQGATAVGTDDGDELSVLNLLSSLVDKSLLQTELGVEDSYRLLESTRQYAREKLLECGEFQPTARRHLDYLGELFRKSAEADETMVSSAAVAALAAQLEDARNALDWGAECCAGDAADLFLATRLWIYLGLNREAIDRAQRMIGLLGERDSARLARLWERVAASAAAIGHYASAKEGAQRAVQYARVSGDSGIVADCLLRYAVIMGNNRAFDEAAAALDEADALAAPSLRRELQALNARGFVASIKGDLEIATRCYAQLRDRYTSLGSDAGTVSISINLAEKEYARGETVQAIHRQQRAIEGRKSVRPQHVGAVTAESGGLSRRCCRRWCSAASRARGHHVLRGERSGRPAHCRRARTSGALQGHRRRRTNGRDAGRLRTKDAYAVWIRARIHRRRVSAAPTRDTWQCTTPCGGRRSHGARRAHGVGRGACERRSSRARIAIAASGSLRW